MSSTGCGARKVGSDVGEQEYDGGPVADRGLQVGPRHDQLAPDPVRPRMPAVADVVWKRTVPASASIAESRSIAHS